MFLKNFSFINNFLSHSNSSLSSLMIWPVCFMSLAHFVHIDLFISDYQHISHLHFPLDLSWRNVTSTDQQVQLIVKSKRNPIIIDPCSIHPPQSHFIARCFLIDPNRPISYRCQTILEQDQSHPRSKRDENKRPSNLFLILIVGIPCFVVGMVTGLTVMIFILFKRRPQRRQTNTKIKSLDMNSAMTSQM